MKQKIVLCYDYFLPAYKAGGPIQSIANLIRNLHNQFDFFVITSNSDMGENNQLNIISNSWENFENGKAKVIYLSNSKSTPFYIKKLIKEINPDKILVNGIYSISFSLAPAYFFSNKTIMHVRGMLHPGALSQKYYKKRLFLQVFKLLRIHNKIDFCASDDLEAGFIKTIFGLNTKVKIAQNFPAINTSDNKIIHKEVGSLKLISIALISKMKNHALVLEALNLVKSNVLWEIYGPIKDKKYWNYCELLIANLPKNIKVIYKGEINPNLVFETLPNFHFFILPSESENFGHALFEALISGTPIITSNNTPWNDLDIKHAGYNVELNSEAIATTIEICSNLNHNNYLQKVTGAVQYTKNAIDRDFIINQHNILFK